MRDVTQWFVTQCRRASVTPKRAFYLNGSDHGPRVTEWPEVSRTINDLSSVKPSIKLDNTDGIYNGYYINLITMTHSAELKIGFTHPTSGDELTPLYSGWVESVEYSRGQIEISLKDRLADLEDSTVSADDTSDSNVVSFAAQAPSSLAWTIVTCYGGYSSTVSSNPDIEYSCWSEWAGYFETNNIDVEANYSGNQVVDILTDIADYTYSSVYVEGNGKLVFRKRLDYSSTSVAIALPQDIKDINISISLDKLANQQWVYAGYVPDSETYSIQVYEVDSVSQVNYGVYEGVLKNENVWFTTSLAASFVAESLLFQYANPPIEFDVEANGLGLIWLELHDQFSLVDSFYGVSSAQVWRVVEYSVNMQDGSCVYHVEGGTAWNGLYKFRLSSSTELYSQLDGSDILA